MEVGHGLGLVNEAVFREFLKRQETINQEISRLNSRRPIWNQETSCRWKNFEDNLPDPGHTLAQLLRRPEISYSRLCEISGCLPVEDETVQEAIEISIKYEGYIKRQLQHIEKFKKLERKPIPKNFTYDDISGFSKEVAEKLSKVKPASVGQASRISGVTPAAISLLLVSLERQYRAKQVSTT